MCVCVSVEGGVGWCSITKLNTKIKLPASYCKGPRTGKYKLRKFGSEVETREGAERGGEQCFCCSVLEYTFGSINNKDQLISPYPFFSDFFLSPAVMR